MRSDQPTTEWHVFAELLDTDANLGQLSTSFENAIRSQGKKIASAFVLKRGKQLGFLIRVELPPWAQNHVASMEEESYRQMMESIAARSRFV